MKLKMTQSLQYSVWYLFINFRSCYITLLWLSSLRFCAPSHNNVCTLHQSHKQGQNWTDVQVISLSRRHIEHHKSLNVWKMDAHQVHLKLPGAALVGDDFKLDCRALHGGHSCHTKRENTFVSSRSQKILAMYSPESPNLRQYGKEESE